MHFDDSKHFKVLLKGNDFYISVYNPKENKYGSCFIMSPIKLNTYEFFDKQKNRHTCEFFL